MSGQKKNTRGNDGYWIYGRHACVAAINNSERSLSRLMLTQPAFDDIESRLNHDRLSGVNVEIVDIWDIERQLDEDTVHQGAALKLKYAKQPTLASILDEAKTIVVLDQVTDPQNIGAILRSAAAFGVSAIVVPDKNSPQESASMVKTSCGGFEVVPYIRVPNIKQAIELLKKNEFWVIGMDGQSSQMLYELPNYQKMVIVMGAEGAGLRRLTQESCDVMVKLPMHPQMESLNVSNAAAIALYERYKQLL